MNKFPEVKIKVTGGNPELNRKVINALHHLIGSKGITTVIPEDVYDDRPVAGSISELEEDNVQIIFTE